MTGKRNIMNLSLPIFFIYCFSFPIFAQPKQADCQDKSEPAFEINISVPKPIILGEWFTIKFSIHNTGTAGACFKIPWKWASNGMLLRATDEKGKIYESVGNFHIHNESDCIHFKPIDAGDQYIIESGFMPPGKFEETPGTIEFPKPGKYRLKWIYNPAHLEEHERCAIGGWPIWKKPLESPEIEVIVLPKKESSKSTKSK
jgi:hypothetical protein